MSLNARQTGDAGSHTVAIIGAGMSGICIAIKLLLDGVDDIVILEKEEEIGGTWRDNTYPGLACDVPCRYYSFSFAPSPEWSRLLASGSELQQYFLGVVERYDLRRRIRFGVEVTRAAYTGSGWRVDTADGGSLTSRFLISANGVLHHPVYPDLPGLESFEGSTMHSARWDHDVDLKGKRVGVIGTGSTGVQIITALAREVGQLVVFQRTAPWIYPIPNLRYRLGRTLARRFPSLNRFSYKFWQFYIEYLIGWAVLRPGWQRWFIGQCCRLNLKTVRDPELRRKLTPDYDPMCKRLIVSGGFYREIQRPNVALTTEAIESVEPSGVRTADGQLHELDVLVLATGFDAHAYLRPMELLGEGGVSLSELWRDGVWAYRTVAMPRFPNFFMMVGPYSPFGNQSNCTIAETQADYIVKAIRLVTESDATAVAPTLAATERFKDELASAMPSTIWLTGCRSWYLGQNGSPVVFPWVPKRHREMLSEPRLDELELTRGAADGQSPQLANSTDR